MSERMTSIRLPGLRGGAGLAEYGRESPEAMISKLREYAAIQKKDAEAILSALDSDFRVETYIGVHVHRQREVLQEGMKP